MASLEARISALEQREQPSPEEAPVAQTLEPVPAAKLQWIRSAPDDVPPPGLTMPDPLHEQALVHNLRALAGSQIMIRSAEGNEKARQLAERFKELFTQADWTVNGVAELAVPHRARGLALAAGTLPPTRDTTRTFLAFTAAGFALDSRLDMSLHSDETMLIVA